VARPDTMSRLGFRVTERTLEQIDALAVELGITRTRLLRRWVDRGLRERGAPPADVPGEDELLALLSERARAGNVAAMRTLLARQPDDPREVELQRLLAELGNGTGDE
jgi:hypothetical protein